MSKRCILCLTTLCAVLAPDLRAMQRAPESCERYEAALRASPNAVAAAVALGRCSFRDYEMIAPGGDSSRLAFRSSWSVALRALRHAVSQDPGLSTAYRPLFGILFAETRDGCSSVTLECRYVSPVIRDGDSVLTVPRLVRLNVLPDTYDEVVQQSQTTLRANLAEARDLAIHWRDVAPDDRRPHEYLGQALLRLGDATAAVPELEVAAVLGTPESRRSLFWDRMEALVKSNRGTDARRVLDETVSDAARDTARLGNVAIAQLNALLGRYRPPPMDSALARRRQRFVDSVLRANPAPPHTRSTTFAELLASGDTSSARRMLAQMDSLNAGSLGRWKLPRVGEVTLSSAQQHLALGDTAGALAQLAEIERALADRRFKFGIQVTYGYTLWLGRAWLLAGDLATAQQRPDEAKAMYERLIGLWGGGDVDVQPLVEEARGKLAAVMRR